MKRTFALLFVLTLIVSACGDDDTSGGGPAGGDAPAGLVEDLTAQILGGSATSSDVPFDDEQAACFAVGLIDEFGADAMVDALQMEFDEFMAQASNSERMSVVNTMLDCLDFEEMMAAEFGGAISDESARCVSEAFVGSDAFRQALANSFDSTAADPFEDPAVIEELLPAMLGCMSAEELVNLGGLDG